MIFPSLVPRRPRLRKRSKPESASRPAASVISRRGVDGIRKALRLADEPDCLLKFGGAKLGHYLIDTCSGSQQDGRDEGFGHALSGGAADLIRMKIDTD